MLIVLDDPVKSIVPYLIVPAPVMAFVLLLLTVRKLAIIVDPTDNAEAVPEFIITSSARFVPLPPIVKEVVFIADVSRTEFSIVSEEVPLVVNGENIVVESNIKLPAEKVFAVVDRIEFVK